jgi:hypothetical protein
MSGRVSKSRMPASGLAAALPKSSLTSATVIGRAISKTQSLIEARLERHGIKRGKVRAVKMPIRPDACKGAVRGITDAGPSSRRYGTDPCSILRI